MSGVRVPTGEATFGEFANCGGHIQHSFTQCNHRVAVMQHECIEPLGESRSDHPIFLDLATRLGLGAMYSEGMTELIWSDVCQGVVVSPPR